MKKGLVIIQKILAVLGLFLPFSAIFLSFIIDLGFLFSFLIILGLVFIFFSIILFIITRKYYDDYKCKDNRFIKLMNKYNKVMFKTSLFLCVLSFFLATVLLFLYCIITEDIYGPVPLSCKIFLSLFAVFGVLSFVFLLCTPTPESTKCVKQCNYTDFNELKTHLERELKRKKFKAGEQYETISGYKVYTYYKRRASVEYYIVINVDGYAGADSLNEISPIVNNLSYNLRNGLSIGSVKTTIIYCSQERNDFFEKDFSTLLNPSRAYHYCFFAGILFSENKIFIPEYNYAYCYSTVDKMRRFFEELFY